MDFSVPSSKLLTPSTKSVSTPKLEVKDIILNSLNFELLTKADSDLVVSLTFRLAVLIESNVIKVYARMVELKKNNMALSEIIESYKLLALKISTTVPQNSSARVIIRGDQMEAKYIEKIFQSTECFGKLISLEI